MAASIASSGTAAGVGTAPGPIRVLCLGNELISDDGLGIVAARSLFQRLALAGTPMPPGPSFDPAVTVRAFELPRVGLVEVVETALTGMYLLEAVVGASRLIVVDTVVTGSTDPGTGGKMTAPVRAAVPVVVDRAMALIQAGTEVPA